MLTLALAASAVGLLAGLARGGSLQALAALPVRLLWLVPVVLLVQAALFWTPWATSGGPEVGVLHVASYLLLLAVVCANHRLPGMQVLGLGLVLNTLVIAANGGYMPVDPQALVAAGHADRLEAQAASGSTKGRLASDSTVLAFLGDWLAVPPPVGRVYSPGDVLLGVGCALFLARGMTWRPGVSAPSLTSVKH